MEGELPSPREAVSADPRAESSLCAAWDFSQSKVDTAEGGARLSEAVVDSSGAGLDGVLLNTPTQAMSGPRWVRHTVIAGSWVAFFPESQQ